MREVIENNKETLLKMWKILQNDLSDDVLYILKEKL